MKPAHIAILIFLLLGAMVSRADNTEPDLKALRQQMLVALNSSATTDSLYNSLGKLRVKSPVVLGYMGGLDALKAKHAWNPYSKIRFLSASENVLQQAINADPHNIEIRFVRFSIEYHLPGFLGMAKNLADDRDEMIRQLTNKNYGTADKKLTLNLIKFLIDSKKCSARQTEALHQQLVTL